MENTNYIIIAQHIGDNKVMLFKRSKTSDEVKIELYDRLRGSDDKYIGNFRYEFSLSNSEVISIWSFLSDEVQRIANKNI